MKEMINTSIKHGFIKPSSDKLIVFVDGPEDTEAHGEFDWGSASLQAIQEWQPEGYTPIFDWTTRTNGETSDAMAST
jgi:hypothetical protein